MAHIYSMQFVTRKKNLKKYTTFESNKVMVVFRARSKKKSEKERQIQM